MSGHQENPKSGSVQSAKVLTGMSPGSGKDNMEDRSKIIGGSEIAAVMGLSRWKTPLALWAEKTGKVEIEDKSGIEHIELGIELEDFVCKKFEKKSGKKVRRDTRTFTHPQLPYCVAHIDRWVVGGELLEAKTCSAWKAKEWEGEEIPIEYVLQVNWYLGICQMKTGYIAVLIGGQKFLWKELAFDRELYDRQIAAAVRFYEENIVGDKPPMATFNDNETLLQMFPEAEGEIIQIDDQEKEDEINSALEHRLEVMKEITDAENEKSLIDAGLMQIIGESAGIQTKKFKITWSNVSRKVADVEAMKKDGIFDQYAKLSVSRTFRVYNIEKEKVK